MDKRLAVVINALIKSGTYLRQRFLKKHQVSMKEDRTELLGEDLKSEEILMHEISSKFPNDSFLTEETETKLNSSRVWVIDPLCGSYSYLRGVETWSISAAYIFGNEYLLGAVYQPYSNNLYYCQKGKGAFMNKKKIYPSSITTISKAFISIEHAVFNDKKVNLKRLLKDMKRLRVGHGSGGELSYVAAGFIDAVIKTNQAIMHFAGGRAIIEEAGGVFVDFLGEQAPTYLDRNKTINYIAASNLQLAKEIILLLENN